MKVAVMVDTNSGIFKQDGESMGVFVMPMPVVINEETYYEGENLTLDTFFEHLIGGDYVTSSQPAPGALIEMWEHILKSGYDEIVYIPMSSGLSGSCQSAIMLSEEFDGKVHVVNNQRISVTQRQSALDAKLLVSRGMGAAEIKDFLEKDKFNSSIYIMLDTLYYLKKGGRITPAAAAIGTMLKLKPVLTIQGEKLDAFAKARTTNQGKTIMINAIRNDMENRFGGAGADNIWLQVAYTKDEEAMKQFVKELEKEFPGFDIVANPLSLSVACHIGPGALAVACCKKIK